MQLVITDSDIHGSTDICTESKVGEAELTLADNSVNPGYTCNHTIILLRLSWSDSKNNRDTEIQKTLLLFLIHLPTGTKSLKFFVRFLVLG